MSKFNKALNSKIISIMLTICFSSAFIYCPPAYSKAYTLRVPMDGDYDRLNDVMKSIQTVKDKEVSKQDNALASGHNISRREFLKRGSLGLIITILPVLIKGDSEKIIQAMEQLDRYALSFDYLYNLTRREGAAYIQGIYYAVNANKIERTKAEKFLRKIFNDADLLYMREEAVKALIKLDMVTETELEKLIESIPDESVLISIVLAFSEKHTPGITKILIKWVIKERQNGSIRDALVVALSKIGKKEPDAAECLLDLSRRDWGRYRLQSKADLMYALARIGTERARKRIEELAKEDLLLEDMIIALESIELQNHSIEDLIKSLDNDSYSYPKIVAVIHALTDKAIEEKEKEKAAKCIIKYILSKNIDKMGFDYWELKYRITPLLGQLATKEARDYLVKDVQDMDKLGMASNSVDYELSVLSKIGDKEITDYFIRQYQKTPWFKTAETRGKVHTGKSLDFLISSIINPKGEKEENENLAYQLFSACGFKSVEILNKELKSPQLLNNQAENIKDVIKIIIRGCVDRELENINETYDNSPDHGRERVDLYFKRVKNKPEIFFEILALSQEITSHSFPVAYEYLKKYIMGKYGRFDILRYLQEEWRNVFLPEFLFTVAIFDKLEECFSEAEYPPKELANLILSNERIEYLLGKPALLGKILSSIINFKDIRLKDVFIDRILELGKKKFEWKALISLMLEFKLIPQEDRLRSLTIDLPVYNSAWHGPEKDWLKDDVISVGLYWSTKKEGEKAHYKQFPEIFKNGSKIDSFYSNFGGYIDKSKDPYYKDKLVKNGAERILIKKFAGTKRKIEIYLYSSLDAIKNSTHVITISRGHAGEQGNSDYPGLPGTLRFASHCRSINDSDELIRANPDSPIITITGTGRAVETNPTLYYLLEYLGSKEAWGDWRDIKEYIKPHIPESIRSYNFPTDDISFIYAAILQKLRQKAPQKASSLNIQMGIVSILQLLKSLGSKL